MSSTTKKLTFGSILRTSQFVLQVVVALFLLPFMVHSLGDRMYGLWALIGVFIGYYGLLDLGLSSAVQRFIAGAIGEGDEEGWNRICNTSLLIFTGLGCAALLLSLTLAAISPLLWDNQADASLFSKVIVVLGVNMAISIPIRTFIGVLIAQIRFDIIATIEMVTLVLRTTLIVVTLISGGGLLYLAIAVFIATIPGNILYVVFARKNLPSMKLAFRYYDRGSVKKLFSYSIYSFIAKLADQLRFNVDAIVITAFMGLSAVTHYRIASQLTWYFITFIYASVGLMQPVFSRLHGANEHERINEVFFFATKISIYVTTFVGFALIVWGGPFIEVWMGSEYLDAYPVLVILVSGCIIALWQATSINLLFGISKHKMIAYLHLGEGISNLLLSMLLVRHYGLIGVALGTLIPITITKLVIQPAYVCKVLSLQYSDYLKRMGKTLVVALVALLIPSLLSFQLMAPSYISLVILVAVSFPAYSIVVWFLGFSQTEKQTLSQSVYNRFSSKETVAQT